MFSHCQSFVLFHSLVQCACTNLNPKNLQRRNSEQDALIFRRATTSAISSGIKGHGTPQKPSSTGGMPSAMAPGGSKGNGNASHNSASAPNRPKSIHPARPGRLHQMDPGSRGDSGRIARNRYSLNHHPGMLSVSQLTGSPLPRAGKPADLQGHTNKVAKPRPAHASRAQMPVDPAMFAQEALDAQ